MRNFHKILPLIGFIFLSAVGIPAHSAPSCSAIYTHSKTVSELLSSDSRPHIDEVLDVRKSREAEGFKSRSIQANEDTLFKTYQAAAMELLQIADGRTVYLFARDGEWIFDVIQTVLKHHPNGHKLSTHFKLINISRLIARNHTTEQLQNFLRANGMNLEKILRGEEKVLWIDTGNRGSIYLNLYTAILSLIDYSQPADVVNRQIMNLIRGAEGKLIASREKDSSRQVLNMIQNGRWTAATQVSQIFEQNLYFGEYLESKRNDLGIPEDRYQRYRWVVDNIEHTPHFHGRASTLNASGTKISAFEKDTFAIKEDSLGLQLRIADYFSSSKVKSAFQGLLESLLGKPEISTPVPFSEAPAAISVAAKVPATKLTQLNLTTLKTGEWIEMPSGARLQYLKPGGEGRRGIVLQVKDSSNKVYALKIAKDSTEATLHSFAEEVEKATKAEKAGFRVARIIESGKTFHLKEWIEGPLAKDWIKNWRANGFRRDDPGLIAIKKLVRESARRGLYTGDLNRKNLIWIGEWVVIDSGSTRKGYSTSEALTLYYENISSRWAKELGPSVATEFRIALED